MRAKVLRDFLFDGRIVESGDEIEVGGHRARELQSRDLVIPLHAQVPAPEWFPAWRGETCLLIASGPSAAETPLESAKGRARAIAINNSWGLAPWSDVLYANDFAWWERGCGVPEFAGLKVSQDDRLADRPDWGIRLVTVRTNQDRLLTSTPGEIGWGGNSGFSALNLAVQFGCKRIILVGMDMRIDQGLHWHGKHSPGLNNPTEETTRRWRRVIDGQAPALQALGVEVVNVSPHSALHAYPKMTLEEALT